MRKIIAFFCFLFLLFFKMNCEENLKLKLSKEDAINMALQKNLGIKIEKLNLQEKKWALGTSWNKFIPSMTLSASLLIVNKNRLDDAFDEIKEEYEDNGRDLSNSDVYDTDEWEDIQKGSVSGIFNLSLSLNAKLIFEVRKTVLDWEIGKISLEIAKKELEKNIKKSYYNLLLLSENIEITAKNLETAKNRYDLINKKYQNGIVTEIEKLNAEFSYENIKPELLKKKYEYENVLLEFKNMLDIKDEVNIDFVSIIEPENLLQFDEKELSINYINKNLELKKNNSELKNNKNSRNIYISGLTPTVTFSFSMDSTYQKSDPFGEDDNWFDDPGEDWKEETGNFTFTVSIPISSFVPFSKEQMDIVNSSFEVERKKTAIDKIKQNTELEIKKIIRRVNNNYQLFKPLKLNFSIAEKAYKQTEKSFLAGTKTLTEVEDSEKNLNEARLKILQTKFDYLSAIYDLEYILDTKIDDIVKELNKK